MVVYSPVSRHVYFINSTSADLNYAHLGEEWMLSRTCSRFWIKARSTLKGIRDACITCERLYASPMSQKMSDLPDDRCEPNVPAFCCVGLDVFCPFYINQGRASVKEYFRVVVT